MHKYIFTDTNLFEQFVPIADIDWLSLADCSSATLIVPAVTLYELNEHKDGAPRGRVKRKAAAVLSLLREYSRRTPPVYVRTNVEIQFRPHEPTIDFARYRLNERVNDDRLLGSAVEFAIEQGLDAAAVFVTTGDFGLELRTKSQQLIAPLPLPDDYRLPPELDDEQKQVRELQLRLRELEAASPDLVVAFRGGALFAKRHLARPQPNEGPSVKELVAEERSHRPYLQHTTPQTVRGWQFSLSTPEDIDRYNDELQAYFEDYGQFVTLERAARQWQMVTTKLELELENKGGAPGLGIHVDIHFPDGFLVLREQDLPKPPERPQPPSTPNQRVVSAMKSLTTIPSLDFTAPKIDLRPPANARLSSIKKTNSYVVRFEVTTLKHTLTEPLPPVYIHFPSFEQAAGFQFEYSIVASNYPKPFQGALGLELIKN